MWSVKITVSPLGPCKFFSFFYGGGGGGGGGGAAGWSTLTISTRRMMEMQKLASQLTWS